MIPYQCSIHIHDSCFGPISAFYPRFSVLSPFQRFIPILAFYPQFSVLSSFQCFIPISVFYPHFSVVSPFQCFIPISAFYPHSVFYPHFSVISSFQCFISISVFYPHFSVVSPFQCFILISVFYPHFSVLSPIQRFIPISVSVFSFRFGHSVSAFYPDPSNSPFFYLFCLLFPLSAFSIEQFLVLLVRVHWLFHVFEKSKHFLKHSFMQGHIDHHNSLYIMYRSSFRYMKAMFLYASDCGVVDHYF